MRWLYAVQEHLLGFIERADKPGLEKQKEVVAEQRRELAHIESYYLRTAAKAGRIVYVSGMLFGATVIAAVCTTVAILLTHRHHPWNHDVEVLLLCVGSGAVGALVSVLSRMSAATDKFAIDFEVGRPLLRRLGLYKPLVGSVFGVALYFLLASGLLMTKPPAGKVIYFYAHRSLPCGLQRTVHRCHVRRRGETAVRPAARIAPEDEPVDPPGSRGRPTSG